MTAKLADHTIDVQMMIESDDLIDVQMCALTAIRTALHVAGAATPGWEVDINRLTTETRAVELQDA